MTFIRDIIKLSWNTVKSNKLRTGLSMLGIIIGVMTIVLVIAVGNGVKQQLTDQFKTLSLTSIFIAPEEGSNKLSELDIPAVKASPYIGDVAAATQGGFKVSYADESDTYATEGVTKDYLGLLNLEIDQGSLRNDSQSKTKVVLIGSNIAKELMGYDNPRQAIGKEITIKRKKFTVIGVLKETGVSFGPFSYDETLYVPLASAKKYLIKGDSMIRIIAMAKDVDVVDKAIEDIAIRLRKKHKLSDDEADSFVVIDAGGTVGFAQTIGTIVAALLTSIATIVLIVSGIGIMNVMFASVAERTKEIGILKAIGASRKNILTQFLVESMMITTIAGLIGLALGELIIAGASQFSPVAFSSSLSGDLLALGFALLIGLFFGGYPAYKASKLDPVDALRG